MNPERSERIEIPVLPLRDVVVYPHMVIPLFVGREKSIRCLEAAMDHDKKIMLVAQKEASTDEPGVNDLFTVGTVASILQMLKLPDGTVKVLVEGLQRARITTLSDDGEHFSAKAEYLDSPELDEREQEVLVRTAISQFEGYIKLNKKIPPEVLTSLNSIDDPARLADTIAAHMPLKLADKQSVLEMSDVNERLEYLMAMMESEIDLLTIETACVPGKGKLTYTGSLGEVMQESIQAALTVVRARAEKLGINPDFYEKRDIHVHVPEGATPKDGPSAGIAMCTALVSCLTGNPVRADVAMTGEITLRGQVLPIGGLKEKLLAAHRGGIKTVLIPYENKRDLEEIPDNVIADLQIHPVKRIEEVLSLALQNEPSGMQVVTAK
ncbi:S16 family serine protease [Enterobacter roggenkampii]|uniref:S16 family serine protease n=1 Tax=Enterobacter roggenkampii TaxID=1812935 RepID=UPI002A806DFD|nr:S16 family serine protease [Enterobacter roggenkampii]